MIKPRKLLFLILTVILVCIVFAVSASADNGEICYGAATVSATQLNIRSGPSTDNTILGTANDKAILVIIEKTNDDWYRVNYYGTVGYVKADYLTNILTAENFSAAGSISKTDVRLRKTFNAESDILATFQPGKSVEVIGINTGWYKVVADGNTGYIRSDLMEIVGPGPNSPAPVVKSLGRQIREGQVQLPLYNDWTLLPEKHRRLIFGMMLSHEGKCRVPIYETLTKWGFNPDTDMLQMPVTAPEAYSWGACWSGVKTHNPPNWSSIGNGGILSDWRLQSSLPGLFAAGGTTLFGSGCHGEAQTTGRYCGRQAAKFAKEHPAVEPDAAQIEKDKALLLQDWEELPPMFTSSSAKKTGREQILDYIESLLSDK